MHRFRRLPVLILLAVSGLLPATAGAQQRPRAQAVDAITAIAAELDRRPLVAIGENHGDIDQHRFLRRLVGDPRILSRIDAIVIEAGSAARQGVVDDYVNGKPVPYRLLARSWRDSVGGGSLGTWDAPIYARFLATVRRINQDRKPGERIRVLLGDPAVPWRDIRDADDLRPFLEARDSHYASVVDRHVMAHGKRALLIAGVFHFLRDAGAPATNVAQHIDAAHPGKLFVVALPGFDPAELGGFEYTRDWPDHSLVALDGTDLGAQRRPRPPGLPPSPPEEDLADAWLTLGEAGTSTAYPTSFDDAWWRELRRRAELQGEFSGDLFHSHCSYGGVAGRGLPVAGAEAGPAGDPAPSGADGVGDPPRPADAVEALAAQLRRGRIVAIGEVRGLDQGHRFLRRFVRSPAMRRLDVPIVVGFGNSRHQRLLDTYLSGTKVPTDHLAVVWQDTSQLLAYDTEHYREFFAAVRAENRRRPRDRHLRVLLGEPALDWRTATRSDVAEVAARRAAFMAGLLRRHAAGRGALLIAERDLVSRVPGSVTSRFPARRTYVAQPHTGFGPGGETLADRLGDHAAGTLLDVRSKWPGDLRSGRNLAGPRYEDRPLRRTIDGLVYLGAAADLFVAGPLPTLFRDRYVAEIRRRHRLLFGRPFSPARAFPTSSCRGAAEQVGPPAGDGPAPAAM